MFNQSEILHYFQGKKSPILLNIILDGFGIGKADNTNAIHLANTPFIDSLYSKYAHTQLYTHGKYVGLASNKDMGGSEVGHLTIGAGKIYDQGAKLITEQIQNGLFQKNPLLIELLQEAKKTALHLLGLLSDGNVHSHIDHLIAIIHTAKSQGVKNVYLHALLDGRDVPIQSATDYIQIIEKLFAEIRQNHPDYDYRIVSGGGRETITMDRAKNWEKVKLGWETHVEGNSGNYFSSATDAIESFRSEIPNLIDQDIPPFNVLDDSGQTKKIEEGDTVLCFNFRGDRAIEITRAFEEKNFQQFQISRRPKVFYVGMMVYDEDTQLPEKRLFLGPSVSQPFGKRILEMGKKQFRLAETQKFPHVTFFFNGGYREPLDPNMETYQLIESDRIASFAEKPKMKAIEITEEAIRLIQSKQYQYGLINFANPDMVGHTGDMQATIEAVEAVDKSLEKICNCLKENNGLAVILADHGNADEMLIPNAKTQTLEPSTKHSLNPVPCVIFDPDFQQNYKLNPLNMENNLSMIAATNFVLMGETAPSDLSPSLFQF